MDGCVQCVVVGPYAERSREHPPLRCARFTEEKKTHQGARESELPPGAEVVHARGDAAEKRHRHEHAGDEARPVLKKETAQGEQTAQKGQGGVRVRLSAAFSGQQRMH